MEQIDYTALVPTQPVEDVVRYAHEQGKFQQEYLIYKADREYLPLEDRWAPAVHVVCSACEREFFARRVDTGGCDQRFARPPFGWWNEGEEMAVISGQPTRCPVCGCETTAAHVGSLGRRGLEDCAWVSSLSRLPLEGQRDRLVLTEWLVKRFVNKEGRTRHEVWPDSAWVVDEKKIVRLSGYRSGMFGAKILLGRWEQRKTFRDSSGEIDLFLPWDAALLDGTTGENCKLNLYLNAGGRYPVSYLALWRKRPAVENLLVQGCDRLVAEWIEGERTSWGDQGGIPKLPAVNWKERRPAKMLGLDMAELRQLRRMRWSADDLRRYKLVRDAGIPVRLPEDMETLRPFRDWELAELLREPHRADFWRIARYLKKQRQDWTALRDYWDMARYLGWALEDSLVRWPRSLRNAHDRAAKEQENRKDELLAARFMSRTAELERFAFEVEDLLIRPCRDQAELNGEGTALHHCVARYAEDHAKGKTAILFIRRTAEPDVPYFTLELDEKNLEVRQNRGLRNCARTPEVETFEAEWLAWVQAGAPRGRDGKPVRPGQAGRGKRGAA